MILNKRLDRENRNGNIRRTSDAFQLALAVLFQNPAQNFALAPNNLEDAPAVCLDFLREVPTLWDDTLFIDGYPGRYVVLARRNGDKWYVCGINATGSPLSLDADLSFMGQGDATYIHDDASMNPVKETLVLDRKGTMSLTIPSQGGFVIVK